MKTEPSRVATVTYRLDDETHECIASFPAVNPDGTGVLTARLTWDERNALNASPSFPYKGSAAVDGAEIFRFTNLWIAPRLGMTADGEAAYKRACASLFLSEPTGPFETGPDVIYTNLEEREFGQALIQATSIMKGQDVVPSPSLTSPDAAARAPGRMRTLGM